MDSDGIFLYVNRLLYSVGDPYGKIIEFNNGRSPLNPVDNLYMHLSKIHFPNNIISNESFLVGYPLKSLILEESCVESIEQDAFNQIEFAPLIELTLRHLNVTVMESGIFNGLKMLEVLTITHSMVDHFARGLLFPCPNIIEATIFDCGRNSTTHTKMELFGLTGTTFLQKFVRFRASGNNLADTIEKSTFGALHTIQEIFLTNNMIQTIGDESFHLNTLEKLQFVDLSYNQLKTVSPGLWHPFFFIYSGVKLIGNPWHCDCNLEHLRRMIRNAQYPEQYSEIVCDSPISMRGRKLINCRDLCQLGESAPLKGSNRQYLSNFTCLTNEQPSPMKLRKPENVMALKQLPSGEYSLISKHFPSNSAVLVFEYASPIGDAEFDQGVNCFTNADNIRGEEIGIKQNIKPNHIYRFCSMIKDESSISPMDCIPFQTYVDVSCLSGWIFVTDRSKIIILCVFVGIFSFLMGIGISCLMGKLCIKSTRIRRKKFNKSIKTLGEYQKRYNRKESVPRYDISYSGAPAEFINYPFPVSQIPPPLPPRPVKQKVEYKCCESDCCDCYCEIEIIQKQVGKVK